MLSNYKGTLLIVSHDRDFLDQTVNKIMHFEGDGKVSMFLGIVIFLTINQIKKKLIALKRHLIKSK